MEELDYESAMTIAQKLEHYIIECKANDDHESSGSLSQNWISKAETSALDFVNAYRRLFKIYKQFNQRDKANNLLGSLFDFVDSCDEFSYLSGLRLLMVLDDSLDWIQGWQPEITNDLKRRLENLIWQTIFYHFNPGFNIIAAKRSAESKNRSAFELLRDLYNADDDKAAIDKQLCKIMELAARFNLTYSNPSMAMQWLYWAAEIAKNRLNDTQLSAQLLHVTSQIHKEYSQKPRSEAHTKAINADVNSAEYAKAMKELSFEESLDVMVQKGLERQHKQRFLPPLIQILQDYKDSPDFISKLAHDTRFILDLAEIRSRADSNQNTLVDWLAGRDYDGRSNLRKDMSPQEENQHRFTLQALDEIREAVSNTMAEGIKSQTFNKAHLSAHLYNSNITYDWMIFEAGIDRFVNGDFISASHILVTQFENIFRIMVQQKGKPVKKNIGGKSGELPLNKLITDLEVQNLIGHDLAVTIDWFMTRDYGPFGYRHKIAHGWITLQECDFRLCALTIWLTVAALK